MILTVIVIVLMAWGLAEGQQLSRPLHVGPGISAQLESVPTAAGQQDGPTRSTVQSSAVMRAKPPFAAQLPASRDADGYPIGPIVVRDATGTAIGQIEMREQPRITEADLAQTPITLSGRLPDGQPLRTFRVSELRGGTKADLFDVDVFSEYGSLVATPTPLNFSRDLRAAIPPHEEIGGPGRIFMRRFVAAWGVQKVAALFNFSFATKQADFISEEFELASPKVSVEVVKIDQATSKPIRRNTTLELDGPNLRIRHTGRDDANMTAADALIFFAMLPRVEVIALSAASAPRGAASTAADRRASDPAPAPPSRTGAPALGELDLKRARRGFNSKRAFEIALSPPKFEKELGVPEHLSLRNLAGTLQRAPSSGATSVFRDALQSLLVHGRTALSSAALQEYQSKRGRGIPIRSILAAVVPFGNFIPGSSGLGQELPVAYAELWLTVLGDLRRELPTLSEHEASAGSVTASELAAAYAFDKLIAQYAARLMQDALSDEDARRIGKHFDARCLAALSRERWTDDAKLQRDFLSRFAQGCRRE